MNQTQTFPAPSTPAIQTTPPGKAFSVTALVCGIVGATFGLIPLLAMLALPLGLVAMTLGLIGARKNKRAGHKAGMARAGWILGTLATTLAVVGFVIVSNAVTDLQHDLDSIDITTTP